jgi:hypothetical protein
VKNLLNFTLVLFFFVLITYIKNYSKDQNKVTNLEKIETYYLELFSNIFDSLDLDDGHSLYIQKYDNDSNPLHLFIQKQIIESARPAGFADFFSGYQKDNCDTCWTIICYPIEFKIDYKKTARDNQYARKIHIETYCKIVSAIKKIKYAEINTIVLQDSVVIDQWTEIENSNLGFTTGKKPDKRFYEKLIQPILVTLATASVIYTFYSYRSK